MVSLLIMSRRKNSEKYLKRAKKIIPALSQTFSKAPYSYVEGVYPTYLEKGKGCYVYDVDNNRYIDYVLGLGPIILGYGYPKVDAAIKNQLKNGISFSIPHRLEVEVSEKISKFIPGAEMVRFAKTGSDAGTAAIRAARAHTKCNNIAYCGTGGVWHDWFTIITSRNAGIPKSLKRMIKKFNYNDIESLKIVFEKWHGEVGAVYIEPMFFEFPKNNFLQNVKKIAHKHGAVLIFDEVISGFRFANGGAQELLKVEADLAVFGKGIANGMPLGAITGKRWIMEQFNDIFYSTSYGGETLSLAAASAVLDELKNKPVVKHCWKLGKKLTEEFNRNADEIGVDIKMNGLPVRSFIVAKGDNGQQSLEIQSLFYQEMIKRGILFGLGAVFLSYSHSTKDIQNTLKSSVQSMNIVKKAIKEKNVQNMLEGKVMKRVMTF